jgi:TRAP-type mannitol/chloroaromatic compound transport system substrate-binding protein
MDRRTFLKSSTAAAALPAGAAVATASSAQPIETSDRPDEARRLDAHVWRFAPPRNALLRDAADRLGKRLRMATGGLIAIEWQETTSHAASLGDLIAAGACDGAFGIAPDFLGEPGLSLFTGLPGSLGLAPDQLLAWHTIAGGDMLLDETAESLGAKVLLAGHTGARPGLWSTRDLTDLRDVAAADIEAAGLGRLVWDRIREPFAPPGTEARATEFPGDPVTALRDARAAGLGYLFRDGLHEQGFALSLVLSRSAWDRLDNAVRTVVEAVTRAAAHEAVAVAAYNQRAVLPAIARAGAINMRPLPGILRQAIDHMATEVTRETIVENPGLAAAWSAYAAFHRDMTGHAPLGPAGPASIA